VGKQPWSHPGSVAPSLLAFSAPSAHAGLFLVTSRVEIGFVTNACAFWAVLVFSLSFVAGLACPLAPKSTGVNLSSRHLSGSSGPIARHNRRLVNLFWELKSPYLPCLETKWVFCLRAVWCLICMIKCLKPLCPYTELLVAVAGGKPRVLVMEALQRSSADPHRYFRSC